MESISVNPTTYFDITGKEFIVDIKLGDDKIHNKINKYRYTGNRF